MKGKNEKGERFQSESDSGPGLKVWNWNNDLNFERAIRYNLVINTIKCLFCHLLFQRTTAVEPTTETQTQRYIHSMQS